MGPKSLVNKAVRSSKLRSRAINNAVMPLEKRLLFAFTSFNPGDLIVEQVGAGGSGALGSAGTAIFLDDFSATATGQSVGANNQDALPTAVTTTGYITASGTATSEGQLTLSSDNQLLAIPGYQAVVGTAGVTSASPSTIPREVDGVNSTGAVTETYVSTSFYSAGNIRGAASDGTNFWTSGTTGSGAVNTSTGGINLIGPSQTNIETSTTLTQSSNTRSVEIYNGNLYYTTGSGTAGIYQVGNGLPQSGGQTTTLLAADTGTSPYAFAISPDGKTIYLADSTSGIIKLTSTTGATGTFTTAYTLPVATGETSGDYGVTVDWSNPAQPILYATTADAAGKQSLVKIVDGGSAAASAVTVLATQGTTNTNEAWRGVAFAPFSTATSTTTAVTAVSPTAAVSPATITFTSTVTSTSSSAPGGSVTFYNGSTALATVATATYNGSVSTFTTSATVPVGSYGHITAVFTPNEGFATSTSPAFGTTLVVTAASTTVTLVDNGPNPSAAGTAVSIGVSIATTNTIPSTDTVTLEDALNSNAVVAGPINVTPGASGTASASFSLTNLTGGTYGLFAVFNGDVNNAPGHSSTTNQTVYPAVSVTGLYNFSGGISSTNTQTSGIDSGGDQVVIAGTNLSSVTKVTFGSVNAKSFTYNASLGAIVAISPAQPASTVVDVVVSNPGSSSTPSNADKFTYTVTNIAGTESTNLQTNSVFTIDDNPTITQILEIAGGTVSDSGGNTETYSYTSFYIQDSTGSEDIFGNKDATGSASLPGGYIPATGNTISVTADESPYQGTPELGGITAISTTGTSSTYAPVIPIVATIPQVNTVAPLAPAIDGYIVTIKGVYISGLNITSFQLNNTSSGGMITDTSGHSLSLLYATTYNQAALTNPSDSHFAGSIVGNLLGQTVPTNNLVDVTGYVDINSAGITELELLAITNPSTIAPVLQSLNPTQGPLAGGNLVTITGAGLTGTTSVSFGGVAGTNVSVVNDQTVTVNAPAHALGSVNLTVTNENGVSNALPYVYTTAPVVSGISPGGSNTSGGVTVTITGTGFTSATAVNFGTTTLTGFTINSDTQITVTAPAHAAGIVDVTVTAPASGGGSVTSAPSSADKFIYDNIATFTISPASGVDMGGTAVTLTGSSLYGTSAVYFGTVAAKSFSYNATSGTLTAVAPAGTNGSVVNVSVTNYAGTSTAVSADQFTYTATTIAAIQPLAVGTSVTIDSNPVISAILSQPGVINGYSYNYYAFLINDGTGSEDIFYNPSSQNTSVQSFVPVVGNTIKITAVIANFRQIDELGGTSTSTVTSIQNTGTAAVPAPIPETVKAVNIATLPQGTGFGSHLITLSNVTVTGQTGTIAGNATQTLTANDSTGAMTLFVYNTSYSTTNEQFTGASFPVGPSTLTGFVYVFTSGTTNTAEFVPVLNLSSRPTWLAPSSQAIWNSAQKTLYVNGASTIVSDPGTDEPIITAINNNSTAAILNIVTISGGLIHIGGLDLTNGSSVNMNSSTGNAAALLVNTGGAFTIDPTSTLNLSNNILDVPNGNLATINALVTTGYNGGLWNGVGITSSTAAGDTAHLTAVGAILNQSPATGNPILYPTVDGATIASTDVLVRETYYGDANISGAVDGSDYSLIDNGFVNQLSGWYNGDFNYDGIINGSDYTLIDNAFNRQGSPLSPAAQVATPSAVVATPSTGNASFKGKSGTAVSLLPTPNFAGGNPFSEKKVKASLADRVLDLLTGKQG